jgi:hypothetical protein
MTSPVSGSTLKALANSSPGLPTLGIAVPTYVLANSEGVRERSCEPFANAFSVTVP